MISFYLKVLILKQPKKSLDIWATFIIKFVLNTSQKQPNPGRSSLDSQYISRKEATIGYLCARLLFRQSEFECHWRQQIVRKIVVETNENKQTGPRVGPFLTKVPSLRITLTKQHKLKLQFFHWAIPASFPVYLRFFKQTILQQINVKIYPSSIRCWDSTPNLQNMSLLP